MEAFSQFLLDIPDALSCFPKLKQTVRDGVPILAGFIDLFAEDGEKLDQYEIEIHSSLDYPNSYPVVYETGGRLPHNIDWHVYPDGHFCIAVPVEERLDCISGINLKRFTQKQVLGFLFNQTFRKENGYFYRERAHGLLGRIEFYREFLKLDNIKSVTTSLQIIAMGVEPCSHTKCFCGSNKKFKKCHRSILRELGKKVANLIIEDYKQLTMLTASFKQVVEKKT